MFGHLPTLQPISAFVRVVEKVLTNTKTLSSIFLVLILHSKSPAMIEVCFAAFCVSQCTCTFFNMVTRMF